VGEPASVRPTTTTLIGEFSVTPRFSPKGKTVFVGLAVNEPHTFVKQRMLVEAACSIGASQVHPRGLFSR